MDGSYTNECTFVRSLIESGTKPPNMRVKYLASEGHIIIKYTMEDDLGHKSDVGSQAELWK